MVKLGQIEDKINYISYSLISGHWILVARYFMDRNIDSILEQFGNQLFRQQ